MQNQINLSPIQQYIQVVRAAELSQQKEVKLTIQQARLLNLTLTEVLDKLNRDLETVYNALKNSSNTDVINVIMDGGGFEDTK
jgi:Fe2+ or Zn2+ uptake regulation protein